MTNVAADKLTPMLRQYREIKAQHPDGLLLFQMGDFYELFFDDAHQAAQALNITLTSRSRTDGDPIPLAGFPLRGADGYITRLLDQGFRLIICDQVEDPRQAKGLVRREVTRVLTRGVSVDPATLEAKADNYLAAVSWRGAVWGLAFLELSTGDFRLTQGEDPDELWEEIYRRRPVELLVPETAPPEDVAERLRFCPSPPAVHTLPAAAFARDRAAARLTRQLGTLFLDGFGLTDMGPGVEAAGVLLQYLADSRIEAPRHLRKLIVYFLDDYLGLDDTTVRNLELFETSRTRSRQGSLLEHLDSTRTPMGGRLLAQWLRYPLKQAGEIELRLDGVAFFHGQHLLRQQWQETLKGMGDLERLTARLVLEQATPRDLMALKSSLERLPGLRALLTAEAGAMALPALVARAAADLEDLADVRQLIAGALVDDPPLSLKEGGVIREGYHPELDELIGLSRQGKDWIVELQAAERQATGIGSLKVRYNKVFGYYLEVSRANLDKVPPHYIRKQTLVNAERFITADLKDYEARVLGAEDRRIELERELFVALRRALGAEAPRLQRVAAALALLDVVAALAQVAALHQYCRPVLGAAPGVVLRAARHPVIEQVLPPGEFVPNDLTLGGDRQVLIITGPNMSGKSTILRQTAVCVLLAQMGSFVPAAAAELGIVDRIFSRVGAVDDIGRGQSTFLVEMHETAHILHQATPRSLVILDEIGRGTSTFDGLSLAWAVAEYLHDLEGAGVMTLFATHYHELTSLARLKSRVQNLQVTVAEADGRIVFLHRLTPGAASKSYGIQVAQLAGVPAPVIARAHEVLINLEAGSLDPLGFPRLARRRRLPGGVVVQRGLFADPPPSPDDPAP